MASIGIGIGIEDLILQVLVLVLVLNFGNCQVLVLVLVLTLGSSEVLVLVLVSEKWYCPCLIHPYATLSVCNAFCLFQENPSFFVLGQKGRRRRSCSYCCMWRFENGNRETQLVTKPSFFLEENTQRKKRCALKIRCKS